MVADSYEAPLSFLQTRLHFVSLSLAPASADAPQKFRFFFHSEKSVGANPVGCVFWPVVRDGRGCGGTTCVWTVVRICGYDGMAFAIQRLDAAFVVREDVSQVPQASRGVRVVG